MSRLIFFGLLLWLNLSSRAFGAPVELLIKFGVSADMYTSVYEEELEPLRNYLAENGVRISVVHLPTATELGDELARGKIDIGILSPVQYVRQHARSPELQPFASHVINGTRYARSYLVVRADSEIRSVASLRQKRLAVTDRDSFGGYVYPRYALIKAELSAEQMPKTVFTGNFLESLRRLHEGEVEAAAVLDEVLRIGQALEMPHREFRVLAKSRRVPYVAYVARPGLPEVAVEKLKELLTGRRFKRFYLQVKSPLELPGPWSVITRRRDARWHINGFVLAKDQDFSEVRRVLAAVEGK